MFFNQKKSLQNRNEVELLQIQCQEKKRNKERIWQDKKKNQTQHRRVCDPSADLEGVHHTLKKVFPYSSFGSASGILFLYYYIISFLLSLFETVWSLISDWQVILSLKPGYFHQSPSSTVSLFFGCIRELFLVIIRKRKKERWHILETMEK